MQSLSRDLEGFTYTIDVRHGSMFDFIVNLYVSEYKDGEHKHYYTFYEFIDSPGWLERTFTNIRTAEDKVQETVDGLKRTAIKKIKAELKKRHELERVRESFR